MIHTEIRIGDLTITITGNDAIPENTALIFQPVIIRDRISKGELSSLSALHKRYEQKLIEAMRCDNLIRVADLK